MLPPLPRLLVPTALSLHHPASFPSARLSVPVALNPLRLPLSPARSSFPPFPHFPIPPLPRSPIRPQAWRAAVTARQGAWRLCAPHAVPHTLCPTRCAPHAVPYTLCPTQPHGITASLPQPPLLLAPTPHAWQVLLRHWSRVLGAQPWQCEHAGSEEPCAAGGEEPYAAVGEGAGQGSGGGGAEEGGKREGGGREGSEGGEGVAAFCSGAGEAVLRHMDDEEPRVRWGVRGASQVGSEGSESGGELAAAEALCALAHYGSLPAALALFRAVKAHILRTLQQQQQPLPALLEGQEEGDGEEAGGEEAGGEGEKGSRHAALGAQQGEGAQEGAEGGVAGEGGEGSEGMGDAPSSPRADQAGLAAAMGRRGGAEGVGGVGGGGGRASARQTATELMTAARGRSLETALRSLQRLLDGLGERRAGGRGTGRGAGGERAGGPVVVGKGGDAGEGGREEEGEGGAEWEEVVGEMSGGTVEVVGMVVRHGNRFVREAAMFALAALCHVMGATQLTSLGETIASQLAVGLGDNWSQVRYAASVGNRALFLAAGAMHHKERYLPTLLPAMVFNRYYGADGVRIYSQDTWQRVMGGGGRAAVAQHMALVAAFYCMQARAQNYLVRETACFCIAEVAAKIDRPVVLPVLPDLLPSLLRCHTDPVWPVRCAACSASAGVVEHYGDVAAQHIATWAPTWLANLTDVIPAVRQHAAALIGAALTTRETQGKALQVRAALPCPPLPRVLSLVLPSMPTSPHYVPSLPSTSSLPVSAIPWFTFFPSLSRPCFHPVSSRRTASRDPASPPDPARPSSIHQKFIFEPVPVNTSSSSSASASAPTVTAATATPAAAAAPAAPPAPAAAASAAAPAARCTCHHAPTAEPWEQSEGAVQLLPFLAAAAPAAVGEFLPTLAQLVCLSPRPPPSPLHCIVLHTPSLRACCRCPLCGGGVPTDPCPPLLCAHLFCVPTSSVCPPLLCAHLFCVPTSSVCPPLLCAHLFCVPTSSVCPTLLCAHLFCVPTSSVCPPLLCAHLFCVPTSSVCPPLLCAHLFCPMGKRQFKVHVELFLPPLFTALASHQPEVAAAAGVAVAELQLLIGPSIFEGRLSPIQREAMIRYKHLIHLRPQQSSEPAMPPHAHHRPGSTLGLGVDHSTLGLGVDHSTLGLGVDHSTLHPCALSPHSLNTPAFLSLSSSLLALPSTPSNSASPSLAHAPPISPLPMPLRAPIPPQPSLPPTPVSISSSAPATPPTAPRRPPLPAPRLPCRLHPPRPHPIPPPPPLRPPPPPFPPHPPPPPPSVLPPTPPLPPTHPPLRPPPTRPPRTTPPASPPRTRPSGGGSSSAGDTPSCFTRPRRTPSATPTSSTRPPIPCSPAWRHATCQAQQHCGGGWKDVPGEVLLAILDRTDNRTLLCAAAVCRGWAAAVFGLTAQLSLSWCAKGVNSLASHLVPHFARLQVLDLRRCPSLRDATLATVAASSPMLTCLLLSGSPLITDTSLHALASHCPSLQVLDLSACSAISPAGLTALAARCTQLGELSLCGCRHAATYQALIVRVPVAAPAIQTTVSTNGVCTVPSLSPSSYMPVPQALAQGCKWLEVVNLGWCEGVTDRGVTAVARGCPGLRVVDLCGCYRITDASVVSLAAHCPLLQGLGLHCCRQLTSHAMLALADGAAAMWHRHAGKHGSLKPTSMGAWAMPPRCSTRARHVARTDWSRSTSAAAWPSPRQPCRRCVTRTPICTPALPAAPSTPAAASPCSPCTATAPVPPLPDCSHLLLPTISPAAHFLSHAHAAPACCACLLRIQAISHPWKACPPVPMCTPAAASPCNPRTAAAPVPPLADGPLPLSHPWSASPLARGPPSQSLRPPTHQRCTLHVAAQPTHACRCCVLEL
ncbi:unnamed protein product [Closterium sp. NIES-65]|nr:unnamed protein product [Closterium sp. NIES-65]